MFAGEAAAVSGASVERRREFATGRHCARRALLAIGEAVAPVLRDKDGAPVWPNGVVGSITHCAGYRAAAVARSEDVAGIGIDAEPHDPLPPDVLDLVAGDEERARLPALYEADPSLHWDRILFCVKEAVFKAWFPLTGGWLEFEDVSATVRLDGTFSAAVGRRTFAGRWIVAGGLILTATSVSR